VAEADKLFDQENQVSLTYLFFIYLFVFSSCASQQKYSVLHNLRKTWQSPKA